jgi:hypothetical protein
MRRRSLYVETDGAVGDEAAAASALRTTSPAPRRPISAASRFTRFGRDAGGVAVQHHSPAVGRRYVEETLIRGVHPMLAKRLELGGWPTSTASGCRRPRDVPVPRRGAREREGRALLAIAEVRDLTPVRDAAGRVVELPYLERSCSRKRWRRCGRRRARAAPDRLYWNRLLLCVWLPARPARRRAERDRAAG